MIAAYAQLDRLNVPLGDQPGRDESHRSRSQPPAAPCRCNPVHELDGGAVDHAEPDHSDEPRRLANVDQQRSPVLTLVPISASQPIIDGAPQPLPRCGPLRPAAMPPPAHPGSSCTPRSRQCRANSAREHESCHRSTGPSVRAARSARLDDADREPARGSAADQVAHRTPADAAFHRSWNAAAGSRLSGRGLRCLDPEPLEDGHVALGSDAELARLVEVHAP